MLRLQLVVTVDRRWPPDSPMVPALASEGSSTLSEASQALLLNPGITLSVRAVNGSMPISITVSMHQQQLMEQKR